MLIGNNRWLRYAVQKAQTGTNNTDLKFNNLFMYSLPSRADLTKKALWP
jgi:hypothetical protein